MLGKKKKDGTPENSAAVNTDTENQDSTEENDEEGTNTESETQEPTEETPKETKSVLESYQAFVMHTEKDGTVKFICKISPDLKEITLEKDESTPPYYYIQASIKEYYDETEVTETVVSEEEETTEEENNTDPENQNTDEQNQEGNNE